MPILVEVIVAWVAAVAVLVVIRVMVLLVAMQVHLKVVWNLIDTCNLRILEVALHLMVLLGMVHLAMVMVHPATVLVMVVMEVMVVQTLGMVALLVPPMGTQMYLMLAMQVVHRVHLEVHGVHKLPLVMVPWAMGMLLHGVLQVLVAAVVVPVQRPLVNLLVELLGMGIKVMAMVGMVEVMDLMAIPLVMGL